MDIKDRQSHQDHHQAAENTIRKGKLPSNGNDRGREGERRPGGIQEGIEIIIDLESEQVENIRGCIDWHGTHY